MRRILLASLMLLAAAAPAAGAVPPAPPRAILEGFACQRAANPLDRAVSVIGVMRPISGTSRMEMRFVLERRTAPGNPFTTVQGGDLGHWLDPKPATLGQNPSDVWRLKKVVANLTGPATYRFRVSFRWLSAAGDVLDRTALMSSTCAASQ